MSEHIQKVLEERDRHFNLPFSEDDMLKSPNDWIATICSLLGQGSNRGGLTSDEFERAIIKVAAVSLAALEHIPVMVEKKKLRKDDNL